jgi:hypothetical protein
MSVVGITIICASTFVMKEIKLILHNYFNMARQFFHMSVQRHQN